MSACALPVRLDRSSPVVHAPHRPHATPGPRLLSTHEECCGEFSDIVSPHFPALVAAARCILGSDDLAWDAVQESLIAFWHEAETPPNPRAWLLRAVTHRSIHLLRTHARRRKHEESAGMLWLERCHCHDPAQSAEGQEFCSELQAALAELPAEQRLVFFLCIVEEMDYKAVAQQLGIPIGTVRSRLNRARAALRQILEPRWSAACLN
jgi:RNA polymerase sigma-70 factor, ECF subfamily